MRRFSIQNGLSTKRTTQTFQNPSNSNENKSTLNSSKKVSAPSLTKLKTLDRINSKAEV